MSADSKLAKTQLERASRAKDKVRRWAWFIVVGAVALLALVGFAAMDYWIMLPPDLRYVAFATLGIVVVLGVCGLIWLFRKPTSLKEAALDAETQRAEIDCVVSTASEYASGRASVSNEYEPELANALQTEAAERLGKVQLPYRRRLVRPLSVLGISLVAIALFVALTPGAWTALKRIVLPWTPAQYTEVEVKPGDIEVRVGDDVEVAGFFSGRPPRDPRFHWQSGDAATWQAARSKT